MTLLRRSTVALVLAAVSILPACAGDSILLHGDRGGNHPFSLTGGTYSIYVHAAFPRLPGRDHCLFVADLQRIAPTKDAVQLGGPMPITPAGPFVLGPAPLTLPAGQYALHVASATDCTWEFSLETQPAG